MLPGCLPPGRELSVHQPWKGSEYQPGDKYTVSEDHTFTAVWIANENKAEPESDTGSNAGSEKDGGSRHVRTGDDTNLAGWLILMLLSAAGAGGIAYSRRRR